MYHGKKIKIKKFFIFCRSNFNLGGGGLFQWGWRQFQTIIFFFWPYYQYNSCLKWSLLHLPTDVHLLVLCRKFYFQSKNDKYIILPWYIFWSDRTTSSMIAPIKPTLPACGTLTIARTACDGTCRTVWGFWSAMRLLRTRWSQLLFRTRSL